GLPPLVGFIGKLQLVGSAFGAGLVVLVIALVINSAISAGYYLKIASVVFFGTSRHTLDDIPSTARRMGAATAAILAIVLGVFGNFLIEYAHWSILPGASGGGSQTTDSEPQSPRMVEALSREDADER
ncbi:MAG: hypothetical protein ACOC3G_05120, partial [Phycisphaeraceae bacterium]